MTKEAEDLEMSRFSIYEWMRKAEAAAKGEVEPEKTPGSTSVEAQRDLEIIEEYKRHPGLGPSQIKNQLRREGIKIGPRRSSGSSTTSASRRCDPTTCGTSTSSTVTSTGPTPSR